MKIINKYVLKRYLVSLLLVLFTGFCMIIISYLFTKGEDLFSHNMRDIVISLFLEEVVMLKDFVPLTVVFGCTLCVRDFAAKSHWNTLHSFGYSKRSIVYMFLYPTCIYAILFFIFISFASPWAVKEQKKMMAEKDVQTDLHFLHTQYGYWMHTNQFFMHIGEIREKVLFDITVYSMGKEFRIDKVIQAPEGRKDEKFLVLYSPKTIYSRDALSSDFGEKVDDIQAIEFDLPPVMFPRNFNVESLTTLEILKYMENFSLGQLRGRSLESTLAQRLLSSIVIPIISVLLVLSSFKIPRATTVGKNLGLGIGLSVLTVLMVELLCSLFLVLDIPVGLGVAGFFLYLMLLGIYVRSKWFYAHC